MLNSKKNILRHRICMGGFPLHCNRLIWQVFSYLAVFHARALRIRGGDSLNLYGPIWAFAYCPMLTSHLSLVDHFELLDRMQTNILLERERCDIELGWVSIQNADLIHLHHSTHPCPHPPSTFRPLHLETLLRHARLVTCWYIYVHGV